MGQPMNLTLTLHDESYNLPSLRPSLPPSLFQSYMYIYGHAGLLMGT